MKNKNIENILTLGIGILMLLFSVYLSIHMVISKTENYGLALAMIGLFCCLSYLHITNSLIRFQYQRITKSNHVLVDTQEKHIIVSDIKSGKTITITNETITAVALYYSWNSNPFSSDLGYSKIILQNNDTVYITQSMVNQETIQSLFKTKVVHTKYRFMNRIK